MKLSPLVYGFRVLRDNLIPMSLGVKLKSLSHGGDCRHLSLNAKSAVYLYEKLLHSVSFKRSFCGRKDDVWHIIYGEILNFHSKLSFQKHYITFTSVSLP